MEYEQHKSIITKTTNQKLNQSQSWLARASFPALRARADYMCLLRDLIGQTDYFALFVIGQSDYLVLVLRHSVKNYSIAEFSFWEIFM